MHIILPIKKGVLIMDGVQLTLDLGITKRYIHTIPTNARGYREKVIEFNGSPVFYVQEDTIISPSFIVSVTYVKGFVYGEYRKKSPGIQHPITDFIPITEERAKRELSDLLEQRDRSNFIRFDS